MRKLLMLLCVMFVCVTGASAANYYFSDCAFGGAGTSGDPYCLDPDFDSVEESFGILFDGVGTDIAAGDNVYLCAGACDGSGTATWQVLANGQGSVLLDLTASHNGDSENPITFQSYAGEFITLDGDTDENGSFVCGPGSCEIKTFVDHEHAVGWKWSNIGFIHSGRQAFIFEDGCESCTFDNIRIEKVHEDIWDGTPGTGEPSEGTRDHAFHIGAASTGPDGMVFTNIDLIDINGSGWEVVGHARESEFDVWNFISIEDSTIDVGRAFFYGYGVLATIKDNFIDNTENGIHYGQDSTGLISGNEITCSEGYDSEDCEYAIRIDEDPGLRNPDYYRYASQGPEIYNNEIWGDSDATVFLKRGIYWVQACVDDGPLAFTGGCTASENDIYNNMLRYIQDDGDLDSVGALHYKPIIDADYSPRIMYNTLHYTHWGIWVDNVDGTVLVRGNLSTKGRFQSSDSGHTHYEMVIGENVTTLTLQGNNNHWYTGSESVLKVDGTSYSCFSSMPGSGNICLKPLYVKADSGVSSTWDHHRVKNDEACYNKLSGSPNPSTDFDGNSRPIQGAYDCGADERTYMCIQPCGIQ